MTASRIIGHRGAKGLALENTMASFEAAVEAGVTCVEFDVHTTLDGELVACHDDNLKRISGHDHFVKELRLAELQQLRLHNGQTVPTLRQVLDYARQHKLAVIAEVKAIDDPETLCALLDEFADLDVVVASFHSELLAAIHRLRPQYKLYLCDALPRRILYRARRLGASGVDIYYPLINPVFYWLANRRHIEIMLFTPNNRLIVRLLLRLYPRARVCTDFPNRFIAKS